MRNDVTASAPPVSSCTAINNRVLFEADHHDAAEGWSVIVSSALAQPVQIEVFGISGFPQMLLRIGWAPVSADPLPVTPRRRLGDVVEYLDGSVFS
jgi:hypothetical protein